MRDDVNDVRLGGIIFKLYYTQGKKTPVCKIMLKVAVNPKFPNNLSATAFGSLADTIGRMHEGDRLDIAGELRHSGYQKDGQMVWKTDVVIQRIIDERGERGPDPRSSRPGAEPSPEVDSMADDVPF